MSDEEPFYQTKEGRALMEKVWKIGKYGTTYLTNPMAQEIVQLLHERDASRDQQIALAARLGELKELNSHPYWSTSDVQERIKELEATLKQAQEEK